MIHTYVQKQAYMKKKRQKQTNDWERKKNVSTFLETITRCKWNLKNMQKPCYHSYAIHEHKNGISNKRKPWLIYLLLSDIFRWFYIFLCMCKYFHIHSQFNANVMRVYSMDPFKMDWWIKPLFSQQKHLHCFFSNLPNNAWKCILFYFNFFFLHKCYSLSAASFKVLYGFSGTRECHIIQDESCIQNHQRAFALKQAWFYT